MYNAESSVYITQAGKQKNNDTFLEQIICTIHERNIDNDEKNGWSECSLQ